MAININTKELLELLETTPASQNIMLSGKHGIGISSGEKVPSPVPTVMLFSTAQRTAS